MRARTRLGGALGLLALGCAGLGLAPLWPLALLAALVLGFGWGAVAYGVNALFATAFGRRSAMMLTLGNAALGAGAIAGPLMVGLTPGNDYRLAAFASALLALAALPLLLATPVQGAPAGQAPHQAARRDRWLLGGFVLLFFLYLGVERDVGGWEPTHLVALGHSETAAANWAALFWAAMTVGRLVGAPISLRISSGALMIGGLALAGACLVLAHVGPLAPVAYVLSGVALGPVFAAGFIWLVRTLPSMRGAGALVLAAANVGGVVFPPLIGRVVGLTSPGAIPTALAMLAGCALLVAVVLQRVARGGM
jgi:fucose permease